MDEAMFEEVKVGDYLARHHGLFPIICKVIKVRKRNFDVSSFLGVESFRKSGETYRNGPTLQALGPYWTEDKIKAKIVSQNLECLQMYVAEGALSPEIVEELLEVIHTWKVRK